MSWRRFLNILKTSWRRLEDVWPRRICWPWWRRLEDVFWRRMSKANIFVLIKTSSEDEDQRRLQEVTNKDSLQSQLVKALRNLSVAYIIWNYPCYHHTLNLRKPVTMFVHCIRKGLIRSCCWWLKVLGTRRLLIILRRVLTIIFLSCVCMCVYVL